MRTTTAKELANLAGSDRSTHVRAFIDSDGAGTFVDLTNHLGFDWVIGVDLDENLDTPTGSCSITLQRSGDGRTISPLLGTSGVLALRREVYVEACVLPPETLPAAGDWREIFRGDIDEIDLAQPGSIGLKCSDLYGRLVRTMIETRIQYGSADGTDVEDVIQAILDDNLGAGAVTLYSINGTVSTPFDAGDSPGFAILVYEQQEQAIAEALDTLVRQFGWCLKYRWNDDAAAFVLTLYDPDRENTTPAHEFTSDDYFTLSQLSLSAVGIRTRIAVGYLDAATGLRKETLVSDSAATAAYGPLYMRVVEDEASQINSSAEAVAFASAMLADLKDPALTHEAEHGLFWPAEIGDLLRYKANGIDYDTDQDLAVAALRHSIRGGFGRTVLSVRGSPSGGIMRWLRLDASGQPRIGDSAIGPTQIITDTTGGYNLLPNGEFGAHSRDVETYLPDGWVFLEPWGAFVSKGSAYVYGSSEDAYYSATESVIGTLSLRMETFADYSVNVRSRRFPVRGGEVYSFGADYKVSATSTAPVVIVLHWLDATGAEVGYSSMNTYGGSPGTWISDYTTGQGVTAHASARYAVVDVITNRVSAGTYVYIDRIRVVEGGSAPP